MNDHPLTDKIIGEELVALGVIALRVGDSRAMYYEEDFRVGADWQLKQVMKWLDKHLINYSDDDYCGRCKSINDLEDDLKKAMRPTKTQENN